MFGNDVNYTKGKYTIQLPHPHPTTSHMNLRYAYLLHTQGHQFQELNAILNEYHLVIMGRYKVIISLARKCSIQIVDRKKLSWFPLPENTPDLLADVYVRLAVVDKVVHLGVVLAVRLYPVPPGPILNTRGE